MEHNNTCEWCGPARSGWCGGTAGDGAARDEAAGGGAAGGRAVDGRAAGSGVADGLVLRSRGFSRFLGHFLRRADFFVIKIRLMSGTIICGYSNTLTIRLNCFFRSGLPPHSAAAIAAMLYHHRLHVILLAL